MTNASSDSEGEFFDAEDQDEQSGVGKSGCSEALEERQTVATTGSGSGRVDCVQSHGDGGNEARRESKEHLQKPTVQQTEIRECEVANFCQKPSLSSENKQAFNSTNDLTVADVTDTPMETVVAMDTKETAAEGNVSRKGSGGHDETDMLVQGEPSRDTKETSGNSRKKPFSVSSRQRQPSESGLTEKEILDQVVVRNLDTGETMPLSLAEERIAKGTDPLSLHIMRLTSEYVSSSNDLHVVGASDDELSTGIAGSAKDGSAKKKKKRKRLNIKKLWNKTKGKLKQVKGEVFGDADGDGDEEEADDDDISLESGFVRVKAHHKGPLEFEQLHLKQDLSGEHVGAVWTMKFSLCGRVLATAGQDHVVRIFVLKEARAYFDALRAKYGPDAARGEETPTESQSPKDENMAAAAGDELFEKENVAATAGDELFEHQSFCSYHGHTVDILDLSWSKNYFLLSSSMDRTVRLWHISRKECLCCFQHVEFVTAIAFHPRDDRYFLSGSLDGKLRLWNIPDKRVALWNEIEASGKGASSLITAANFCQNGKYAVVGTYDGRCLFYDTEHLKYHTQIHARSTRGKNAKGRKVTGIEPMPGENKVLISSNDSRLRLYDLKDHSLTCKYKGCATSGSQIRASFNHDGRFIICGSEDNYCYMWRTYYDFSKLGSSLRRDRSDYYERFKVGSAVVTAAVFAPVPGLFAGQGIREVSGEVLLTADHSGSIKVFSSISSNPLSE